MDTLVNNADATYNRFSYTTLCHICKKFDNNVVLKRCSGCRMIFYCSRERKNRKNTGRNIKIYAKLYDMCVELT